MWQHTMHQQPINSSISLYKNSWRKSKVCCNFVKTKSSFWRRNSTGCKCRTKNWLKCTTSFSGRVSGTRGTWKWSKRRTAIDRVLRPQAKTSDSHFRPLNWLQDKRMQSHHTKRQFNPFTFGTTKTRSLMWILAPSPKISKRKLLFSCKDLPVS